MKRNDLIIFTNEVLMSACDEYDKYIDEASKEIRLLFESHNIFLDEVKIKEFLKHEMR